MAKPPFLMEVETMMSGKIYKSFYSGGFLYQVREYEHSDYGAIFKIWRFDDDYDEDEPKLVYTIYREKSVDVFCQNILDANWEYDLNV